MKRTQSSSLIGHDKLLVFNIITLPECSESIMMTFRVQSKGVFLFIVLGVGFSYFGVMAKSINGTIPTRKGLRNNSTESRGEIINIDVKQSLDVQLNCSVPMITSSPIYFEWYKQNPNGRGLKQITQFIGRYNRSIQGHLKIRSVTLEDAGVFVCKLQNRSDLFQSFHLSVSDDESVKDNLLKTQGSQKDKNSESYSEPQIIRDVLPKEKVYHAFKGFQILLLKCESSGNPKPTITWYKNGEKLSTVKKYISPLKLKDISKADNGKYKCESVNLFGISVYEVTIEVTDYWNGASEIIESIPTNLTILAGNTFNIPCVAQFESNPLFVSWVKKVPPNKIDSAKMFFHNGTSAYYEVIQKTILQGSGDGKHSTDLILKNVTKNDSGIYYCAVVGLQGFNYSQTTIIVEGDPTQSQYNNKAVTAQWAILWTSSFIFLVIMIVICFVKMYGCQSKAAVKSKSSKPIIPPSVGKGGKAHLPESSPLTMSTHCTTTQCQDASVPLMVGSCSGLSSFTGEQFDTDYDSQSASNSMIYSSEHYHHQHHHHFPSVSEVSTNNCPSTIFDDHKSFRPNSFCSDYHYESGGSMGSSSSVSQEHPTLYYPCNNVNVSKSNRDNYIRNYSHHSQRHCQNRNIKYSSSDRRHHKLFDLPYSYPHLKINTNGVSSSSSSINHVNNHDNLSSTDCESYVSIPGRKKITRTIPHCRYKIGFNAYHN